MDQVGEGLLTRPHWSLLLAALPACTQFFASVPMPDNSRPVARIETRQGVEYGAATTEGLLFLGRNASSGPCRVHYFLGATPVVEDGDIVPFGGVYSRADIDLKHQRAPLLTRDLRADDELVALLHTGLDAERVAVRLASDARVEGDALADPGRSLPLGTPLFVDQPDGLAFVGLVAGSATLADGSRFWLFTGIERMREALATARPHPKRENVKHRPDDITVIK